MPGTTTTIGAVIDYLVALIPNLGLTVEVGDGILADRTSNLWAVVGNLTEPVVQDGSQSWAATGYAREENYSVSLQVCASVGGQTQKAARDQALALLMAIDQAIVADPTLGGLVRVSNLERLSLQQTDLATVKDGRQAVFLGFVHVQNRIQKAAS